jgi:ABC-type branched-subunit amino acid transport system ATPase component
MSKVKKSTKKFAQKKAQGAVQFKKHKHGHKRSANGLSGKQLCWGSLAAALCRQQLLLLCYDAAAAVKVNLAA